MISAVLVAFVFAAALAVWRAAVKRHLTKVDAPYFSFVAGGGLLAYVGLFVPYVLAGWLAAAISSLAVAVAVWRIPWRRLQVNDVTALQTYDSGRRRPENELPGWVVGVAVVLGVAILTVLALASSPTKP